MHSGTEERERTSLILTLLFGGWALGVRAPETLLFSYVLVSRAACSEPNRRGRGSVGGMWRAVQLYVQA